MKSWVTLITRSKGVRVVDEELRNALSWINSAGASDSVSCRKYHSTLCRGIVESDNYVIPGLEDPWPWFIENIY